MQAALIQNLRQEKLNLEIVSTRLIKQLDQHQQQIDHLRFANQEQAELIQELTLKEQRVLS